MYIHSLEATGFRCFRKAQAPFQYPGRVASGSNEPAARSGFENLNLVLGYNGSGKSSLLKAIALSILGSVLPDSGFRPYLLVRAEGTAGKSKCLLRSQMVLDPLVDDVGEDRGVFQAVLERKNGENYFAYADTGLRSAADDAVPPPASLRAADVPSFFLCGYGSNRRSEEITTYDEAARHRTRSARYQRVASLFEDGFTLTSFSSWLLSISGGRKGVAHPSHDFIVPLLEKLLDGTGIQWSRGIIDGEADFIVEQSGNARVRVPYNALSDGFRAYLAWICDMLRHLSEVSPGTDPALIKGIVLIDEVDLHLPPHWQQRLLSTLGSTFPRLQFIVTSHSPILAGSVPKENVLVVERIEGGSGPSVVRLADKEYYGKAVDDILTGPYFEMESTLPPALQGHVEARKLRQEALAREVLTEGSPQSIEAYLRDLSKPWSE